MVQRNVRSKIWNLTLREGHIESRPYHDAVAQLLEGLMDFGQQLVVCPLSNASLFYGQLVSDMLERDDFWVQVSKMRYKWWNETQPARDDH